MSPVWARACNDLFARLIPCGAWFSIRSQIPIEEPSVREGLNRRESDLFDTFCCPTLAVPVSFSLRLTPTDVAY